ncbi:hypothetical protein TNCV_2657521 [Trichonephila clavipes]|uniref:Uncharacterized protein n=1 Tax=Trichonephila clavipes TaxID=2585209 RepID=A0A8X6V343_TRICX|nr:hypothetical protein TNCV_2657521 [Trichonephila clavipes]
MSDMYIDDVLTGAETLLEAKELKNQLINIFAKGGMVLHKSCGNNTELIEVSEILIFRFIREKSVECLLEPQA